MSHPYVLLVLAGGAALLGIQWYFSEDQKNARALSALHTTPIREAKAGEIVRIEGRVRVTDPALKAPLSGRACVHYDLQVEKQASKNRMERVLRETKSISFAVEDESGVATVEVSSFQATVEFDKRESPTEPTAAQLRLLRAHGLDDRGFLGLRKQLTFREGVLEAGERVVVMGRVRLDDDPEGALLPSDDYREQRRQKRLVIEAYGQPVRATDLRSAYSFSNVR
jgi:hypothetical protein